MPSKILVSLFGRQALIVPVFDGFTPSSEKYEALVAPIRSPDLDVFGFIYPFGVVGEQLIQASPEIYGISQHSERAARREMLVRTRAWLDLAGPQYRKIVMIPYGEVAPVWTEAVQGPRKGSHTLVGVADRIVTVPVHRTTGLGGTIFGKRLRRALK